MCGIKLVSDDLVLQNNLISHIGILYLGADTPFYKVSIFITRRNIMDNKQLERSYYAIIPANVRYDKDLTPNAKLLYGEITALCNEKGHCWATNDYFSNLYGVSKTSISKWINSLVKKGYVSSEIVYVEGTKQIDNRYLTIVSYPIKEKLNTPVEENDNTHIKSITNIIPNKRNITRVNNTVNNKVLKIFEHWKSKGFYPQEQLTETKQKAIEKALKSYTDEQIISYIDNYSTVVLDEQYFFSQKWYIEKFLKQSNALPEFTENGERWLNYLDWKNKPSTKPTETYVADYTKELGDII